jgi:hypothetical protein
MSVTRSDLGELLDDSQRRVFFRHLTELPSLFPHVSGGAPIKVSRWCRLWWKLRSLVPWRVRRALEILIHGDDEEDDW